MVLDDYERFEDIEEKNTLTNIFYKSTADLLLL